MLYFKRPGEVISGFCLSQHLQTLLLLGISREVPVDLGLVTVNLQVCVATCLAHHLAFRGSLLTHCWLCSAHCPLSGVESTPHQQRSSGLPPPHTHTHLHI